MDAPAQAGIRLTGVVVEHIRFDDTPQPLPKVENHKLEFAIQRTVNDEQSVADIVLFARLSPAGEAAQQFLLEVRIAGRFEQDGPSPAISLTDFARLNGPAQVMPFVREIVANITARSRMGMILMPAVNIVALVTQQEAAAAAATAPQASRQ